MAFRFNPPANWPAAPAGWVPPAGWQPDPAWGPVPEGWSLWVEDPAAGPAAPSAPVPAAAPAPAPAKKKKYTALIIGILSVVLVIVVGAVVGLVFLFNTLSAGPPVEGVERAGSIEEARVVLQQTHDEAIDFLESHHGFDKAANSTQISAALEEGNTGESIWDVEMQTATIMHRIEMMTTDSDLWEEAWGGPAAFTDNRSGTDLEAILDEYTGGTVDFVLGDVCDGATACVERDDQNVVRVNELYLDSTKYLRMNYADVLLHEYAHVTQFKYYAELDYSAEYESLFGWDAELHADCMSLAVKPDFVSGYGSVCSAEQLASAKDVWDGIVAY